MTTAVYAVTADLTGEASELTLALWELLGRQFGLCAAQAAIQPHVTFLVGDCLETGPLVSALDRLAGELPMLSVEINGVDVFSGERPTVYLKVSKRQQIVAVQAQVAGMATQHGMNLWQYYQPAIWIPHVTLARHDLLLENLEAVLELVNKHPIHLSSILSPLYLEELVQVGQTTTGRRVSSVGTAVPSASTTTGSS